MLNLKSNFLSIGAFFGAATLTLGVVLPVHAVVIGIPSEPIGTTAPGVGWAYTGGNNLDYRPSANGGFTSGSFDFNGSEPGGTYTNNNYIDLEGGTNGTIFQSGALGAALQSIPLALTVSFEYQTTGGFINFGLSNDGTSITTLIPSNLSETGLPQNVNITLNSAQLAALNSSTTFAFNHNNTIRFSNFSYDVTPVPFEFNPTIGLGLLGVVLLVRKRLRKKV
jgi:hypothetical protein